MITSNILQRVFHIRAGANHGTGFAIPWKGRTYIVTAKHIFDGSPTNKFELFHAGAWTTTNKSVVMAKYPYDIAVIQMPEGFQPGSTITVDDKGAILGEDVYMLGFPLLFTQDFRLPNLNNQFPLPLVSKGCLAAIPAAGGAVEGGMMISAQIDEGFSGGPIVVLREPCPMVIGVICFNVRRRTEETFEAGQKMLISQPTSLVVGYAISIATDLIDAHFAHDQRTISPPASMPRCAS